MGLYVPARGKGPLDVVAHVRKPVHGLRYGGAHNRTPADRRIASPRSYRCLVLRLK
jgi:hypothetical protein